MAQKKFQDLNLANAFLFAAVMSNPDVCRLVLQILLGKPIGSVTVNAEQSMLFSSDCRSIRLDIYADDEDGTMKVFFSTKGRNDADVSTELVNFLRYVENSNDECVEALNDDLVRQIHRYVKDVKKSREWRGKYMRFEELLRKERREGCAEGREDMLTLIAKMIEAGEADKLSKLTDKTFLQEMYHKYGLWE